MSKDKYPSMFSRQTEAMVFITVQIFITIRKLGNMLIMYGLLTKCEVKMAGYWPSSLFACLWTETKWRSINSQNKNEANTSHLDGTNLVNKGFIMWLSLKFFFRDTAGSPGRARWLHLSVRVANHIARFGSSCPPTELAT